MKLSQARLMVVLAISCLLAVASLTTAGFNNGGGNRVGGVWIDPAGVVRSATVQENQELVNQIRANLMPGAGDLAEPADLRMISLAGLQDAIAEHRKAGKRIPSEIRYLAGLTAIEYVYVDTENNDLILAGPAEPWTVSETGSIVGTQSGASVSGRSYGSTRFGIGGEDLSARGAFVPADLASSGDVATWGSVKLMASGWASSEGGSGYGGAGCF